MLVYGRNCSLVGQARTFFPLVKAHDNRLLQKVKKKARNFLYLTILENILGNCLNLGARFALDFEKKKKLKKIYKKRTRFLFFCFVSSPAVFCFGSHFFF